MRGIVKLYNQKHEMIHLESYNNKAERKGIMLRLAKLHDQSEGLYFHINPSANPALVKKDGMNFGAGHEFR